MRHDLAAGPVAVRPRRMGEAAGAAGLVAPAGSPQRSAARLFGARPRAVDLPAVAVPANHHLRPAAGANKNPACVGHPRLRLIAEARWTPCAADAILSAARVRLSARMWGATTGHLPRCGRRRARFTSARRLSGQPCSRATPTASSIAVLDGPDRSRSDGCLALRERSRRRPAGAEKARKKRTEAAALYYGRIVTARSAQTSSSNSRAFRQPFTPAVAPARARRAALLSHRGALCIAESAFTDWMKSELQLGS